MRVGVWLQGGQLSRPGPSLVLRKLLVLPMKQLPTVLHVHPGQHWKEPHLSTNSEYLGLEVKSFPDPLLQGGYSALAQRLAQHSLNVRRREDQCPNCIGRPRLGSPWGLGVHLTSFYPPRLVSLTLGVSHSKCK